MNTKEMAREQVSALADGELAEEHLDVALAALRRDDGRADWDIYHQIGDVLRSDDMAISLDSGFTARMAARLEAEPTIVAPGVISRTADSGNVKSDESVVTSPGASAARRWALPSMAAAAAMATVAFFTTPQLMVAMKGEANSPELTSGMASTSMIEENAVVATSDPEGVVLRDPRIDDYLMAHQRFSPSVYNSVQFARSATFATDSNK